VLTVASFAPLSGASAAATETVLYSFCAQAGCTDGAFPFYAGVIRDASGNLYGTTNNGGANCQANGGCGTVFELTPPAKGKTEWTETVLYSFCARGGTSCTDGEVPTGSLLRDALGHLYSTTDAGGAHGAGTVFELTP
jgi:hypothetical protein